MRYNPHMNKLTYTPVIVDHNPFEAFALDLDGVFADFSGKFYEDTGKWPHEVTTKELWKHVNSVPDYFYSLKLMADADILWEYCKQYNPYFLTGLPVRQGSREQKMNWVRDKFGAEHRTVVVPKREKQNYSGPNKVLIDDTFSNIEQWINKGGHGILHDGDVFETIRKVEELRAAYLVA
jgi:5'(3')-deoxyribonucleotidase